MFIGRKKELRVLNDMYESDQFEFAVIYGRRRVGKSTLIQKFLEHKRAIYYVGLQGNKADNLKGLSEMVFKALMPSMGVPSFASYDELFTFMDAMIKERIVLVLDEYPYMAEGDASLSSVLQRRIDISWKQSKLMLILCGSSMSFMEHQVLGYKSPLYGRRTAQLKIMPFLYSECKEFGWSYTPQEMAVLFAVCGGVGEYMSFINPQLSVKENICRLYLRPSGRMYEEPTNLLKQELRNPTMYHSVLNQIAFGNTTLNEIATKCKELPTSTSFHLRSLMELGIVKKETCIGAKENARKTLYRINDTAFLFWYRFVYANQSMIAMHDAGVIYDQLVEPYLSQYMGYVFEMIAQTYMLQLALSAQAPFLYTQVGRWWGSHPVSKRQEEIDVCAMNGNQILLGECKWSNALVDQRVLKDLMRQGSLFSQEHVYYYLFAKNGFSDALIQEAEQYPHVTLLSIEDIYRMESDSES